MLGPAPKDILGRNAPLQGKSGTQIFDHWIKAAFGVDCDPMAGASGMFTSPVQLRTMCPAPWGLLLVPPPRDLLQWTAF